MSASPTLRTSTLAALLAASVLLAACSGNDAVRIGGQEQESSPIDPAAAPPANADEGTAQERERERARDVAGKQFQCSGDACKPEEKPPACNDCRDTACKTEIDACTADATCPFLRTCLDDCADSACRTACFIKWPDPSAKAKNAAVYKCQCINKCAVECKAECS